MNSDLYTNTTIKSAISAGLQAQRTKDTLIR